jgi:deoxyinosine 3'endonuclease (endonuclease V)
MIGGHHAIKILMVGRWLPKMVFCLGVEASILVTDGHGILTRKTQGLGWWMMI